MNLIAAVIVTVCLPQSDFCDLEVPASWRNPTAVELHQCAQQAEDLILAGHSAHCEVAYGHHVPAVEDTPIHDLADITQVEEFLAPLKD